MHAADIMTRKVLTVAPEATIDAAMRSMLDNAISGLPVVDAGGRLVGMVTEGDFLRRAELGTERRRPRWLEILLGPGRIADEYAHSRGRKVAEVMTREVTSVAEDTPAAEVVRLMERRRIKRVPVLRDGALVGIVTRANLLRALASIAAAAPAAAGDRAIRERLLAELERQSWTPQSSIDVTVRNGVVQLWGIILDEAQRRALRVAAENVPGVTAVEDNTVWVEPFSGFVVDPPNDKAG
jgi:CBS domain-containing protein